MNLFKIILQEANKARFLSKLYLKYNKFVDYLNESDATDFEFALQQNNLNVENYYEPLLAFVNSNATDKYKFSWQQKDDLNLWQEIIRAFTEYLVYGTKSQAKKYNKNNPKQIFYDSGLKVANYGESKEKVKNADFVFFNEQENENFIFVGVLSYKAAIFCDSYNCGGSGAKWCIGHSSDSNYWNSYSQDGSSFVLAYYKKNYGLVTKQKYMLELYEYTCNVWRQDDNKIENANLITFGLDSDIIQTWYNYLIHIKAIDIKLSDTQKDEKFYPETNNSTINLMPEEPWYIIPNVDFVKLSDSIEVKSSSKFITYNNKEPIHIKNLNGLRYSHENTTLYFNNCDRIQIDNFYYKNAAIVFNNSNIIIDNLYIPINYFFEEEELDKYKASITAGNIVELVKLMAKYNWIAGNPFSFKNKNITINNFYLLPREETMEINPSEQSFTEIHKHIFLKEDGKTIIDENIKSVDINCYKANMSDFIIGDKIIINEIIKPTTKLKGVRIYNYNKNLTPIWVGEEELRPGKFYMLPCYSKEY